MLFVTLLMLSLCTLTPWIALNHQGTTRTVLLIGTLLLHLLVLYRLPRHQEKHTPPPPQEPGRWQTPREHTHKALTALTAPQQQRIQQERRTITDFCAQILHVPVTVVQLSLTQDGLLLFEFDTLTFAGLQANPNGTFDVSILSKDGTPHRLHQVRNAKEIHLKVQELQNQHPQGHLHHPEKDRLILQDPEFGIHLLH